MTKLVRETPIKQKKTTWLKWPHLFHKWRPVTLAVNHLNALVTVDRHVSGQWVQCIKCNKLMFEHFEVWDGWM